MRYSAEDAEAVLAAWRLLTADAKMRADMPRQELHARQGSRCYLCAKGFQGARNKRARGRCNMACTRDHVFPAAHGGSGHANILLAHKTCNERKADRWPYPCEVIYLAAVYAAPVKRRAA